MQMNEGLDTGDILFKRECAIEDFDTTTTLHNRLAAMGAGMILNALSQLEHLTPVKQDESQSTYASKIKKQESNVDWTQPATDIERQVRAFIPWPMAHATLNDERIRLWDTQILATESSAAPGTIIDTSAEGVDVATGNGVLRITRLQLPGGKPMDANDIVNGHHALFEPGKQFQPTGAGSHE